MLDTVKKLIKAPFYAAAAFRYNRGIRHASERAKLFQDFKGKPSRPVTVTAYSKIRSEYEGLLREHSDTVVFADKPSLIAGGALKKIEDYFDRHPEVMILYGDSGYDLDDPDVWFYRPNWSPHYFLYAFYTGGLFAVRGSLLEAAAKSTDRPLFSDADPLFDAMSVFYHLGSRAGAFSKNISGPVGHIPFILYREDFEKEKAGFAKAAESFFKVAFPPPERPRVSAMILSKDHPETVRTCVESMERCAADTELEMILVDNGSTDENRMILERFCSEHGVSYHYEKCDFNFSKLCNFAADHATGDYYLFCNDDIEFVEPGTIYKLAETASFDFCGEAGIKLLYPENDKIQHAGVVNVIAGPTHKYQYCEDDREYYFGINRNVINVICATAACVMLKKERFLEAGRFPEELAVAFNDVALGFSLTRLGYYNACRNDIHAIHYESLTRGYDFEDEAKMKRLMREHDVLYDLYPEFSNGKDPYLSPYMSRTTGHENVSDIILYDTTHLVPVKPVSTGAYDRYIAEGREDLMLLRIFENFQRESEIKEGGSRNRFYLNGYCFVYRYDNIGLRKRLVLSGPGGNYEVRLKQVHRPDIVKDYPNEKNIAFAGFEGAFDASSLVPGEYRIFFYIYDTCSRLKQFRVAERTVTIEQEST